MASGYRCCQSSVSQRTQVIYLPCAYNTSNFPSLHVRWTGYTVAVINFSMIKLGTAIMASTSWQRFGVVHTFECYSVNGRMLGHQVAIVLPGLGGWAGDSRRNH